MRKTISVLILLAFLLASCNFPITQHPTPDLNVVATRVAGTLSAMQTQVLPIENTPVIEVQATLTPTETFEPTQTATATATVTSTPPAGDPALTLGEPDFFDTFSNGTAFGLNTPYEDDAVIIKVKDGAMIFKSLRLNNGIRWRLTSRNPLNLYLEGTFKTISCSGSDQYGLVVRAPTYTDGIGYYFGVTCNGQYYLLNWTKTGTGTLVNLTSDTKILSGSGQVNRLGIMVKNDSIGLYINGSLIKEVTDKSIASKGYIGAFVSAHEDNGFTVQLEEISLWTLP